MIEWGLLFHNPNRFTMKTVAPIDVMRDESWNSLNEIWLAAIDITRIAQEPVKGTKDLFATNIQNGYGRLPALRTISVTNFAVSRFHQILQWDVLLDIETWPWLFYKYYILRSSCYFLSVPWNHPPQISEFMSDKFKSHGQWIRVSGYGSQCP